MINEEQASQATQAEAAAPSDAEPMIPQSRVNALVAQARRDGEAKAAKRSQSDSLPAPAQAQVQDQFAALSAQVEELKTRGAFDKAMLGRNVSEKQSERLFKLYTIEKPTDIRSWLDETIVDFGLKAPEPNQSTQTQTETRTPKAAPADSIPKPFDFTQVNGVIPLASLTPEQSRDPVLVRRVFEHNWDHAARSKGAPRQPRKPGQK
ncbi:MAG: hypothetical protein E6Q97_38510 [Desulfurellales bacterium]|nr:MAG: hypothetical protein E6Q97_38510 [Desulfurellales bacterium]